jgi:hypothetical protein
VRWLLGWLAETLRFSRGSRSSEGEIVHSSESELRVAGTTAASDVRSVARDCSFVMVKREHEFQSKVKGGTTAVGRVTMWLLAYAS